MFEITAVANENYIEITEGHQDLIDLDIYKEFVSALSIGNIENYYFNSTHTNYKCILIGTSGKKSKYKLIPLKQQTKNSKNKYQKVEIKQRQVMKIVKDIGLRNAQMLHAEDELIPNFIHLRQYLRKHPDSFSEIKVYELDGNQQYQMLRFKNLFSKYADEISDFEKILYIERQEDHLLVARYKLDVDILDYNLAEENVQIRKDARNFAKEVYTRKSLFKDKELLDSLQGRNLYVKIYDIKAKEHKDVWSKITIEEMLYPTLKDAREYYKTENVPASKSRKYMSKRSRRRQSRRSAYNQIKFGIETYDQME